MVLSPSCLESKAFDAASGSPETIKDRRKHSSSINELNSSYSPPSESRQRESVHRNSKKSRSPRKLSSESEETLPIEKTIKDLHKGFLKSDKEKVQKAKKKIASIVSTMEEERRRRKDLVLSPSRDSSARSAPRESLAVSGLRVLESSSSQEACQKTLVVLNTSGLLSSFAQELADGAVKPESSDGRAILSILSKASEYPESRSGILRVLYKFPPNFHRLCEKVLKNGNVPVDTRTETASMLKLLSENSSKEQHIVKPDPLSFPDSTITQATSLLAGSEPRRIIDTKEKRKPRSPSVSPIQTVEDANGFIATACNDQEKNDVPETPSSAFNLIGSSLCDDGLAELLSEIKNFKLPIDAKQNLAAVETRMADLLSRCAKHMQTQKFREAAGPELFLDLTLRNQSNEVVLAACLETFASVAEVDQSCRDFCVKRVGQEIDPQAAAQSPKAADAYASLLMYAILHGAPEDAGLATDRLLVFRAALSGGRSGTRAESTELQDQLDWLCEISADNHAGLTLEGAYRQLDKRKATQQTIIMKENRSLRRFFDFIYETCQSYNLIETEELDSFFGKEIMYGCLSFQLLLEENANEEYMINRRSVPNILLNGIKAQKHPQVSQHLVLTAVHLCERGSEIPMALVRVDHGPDIVADTLGVAVSQMRGSEPSEVVDLLKPRLELVQHMACTSDVFARTSVMKHLITLWDDTDVWYYTCVRYKTLQEVKAVYAFEKRESEKATKNLFSPSSPNPLLENCHSFTIGHSFQSHSTTESLSVSPTVSPLMRSPRLTLSPSTTASKRQGSPWGDTSSRSRDTSNRSSQSPSILHRASVMQRRASITKYDALELRQVTNTSDGTPFQGTSFDGDFSLTDTDERPDIMPHILKAMRKVFCDSFVELLTTEAVPMRLLGLITNGDTDPSLLPDALFLIATLAVFPELRDHFGEISAIECILGLLGRAYPQAGLYVSEVVCNCCLALCKLCGPHVEHHCGPHVLNKKRFTEHRGVELTIAVLHRRGELNDTKGVNGASSLVCNLCFKDEAMKTSFGEKGGCEAFAGAMKNYKSSNGATGTRCISSLFKAVGNLTLTAYNMNAFMKVDIQGAYCHFLNQATDELDNETLETCFKTLANSVIEKEDVEKFEFLVVPVLATVRRIRKTVTELYRWAFETIGNLCRNAENAKVFTTNEGIQTILNTLPFLASTDSLHGSAIFVLGIQTTYMENIPILIAAGLFTFIKSILDNSLTRIQQYENECGRRSLIEGPARDPIMSLPAPSLNLPIAALRCMRRAIAIPEAATECLSSGCFCLVLNLLELSYDKSMLMYEGLRVLFTMVARVSGSESQTSFSPPTQTPTKSRFSSIFHRKEKAPRVIQEALAMRKQGSILPPRKTILGQPHSPQQLMSAEVQCHGYGEEDKPRDRVPIGNRAYEVLGLSPSDIDTLIVTTRKCLAQENVSQQLRLYRLGLGCLTYFACEKVGFPALYRRLHFDDPSDSGPITPTKWELRRRRSLLDYTQTSSEEKARHDQKEGPTPQRRLSLIRVLTRTAEDSPPSVSPSGTHSGEAEIGEFGQSRLRDKTSIIDLIFHAFNTFLADPCILEVSSILLSHMVLCAEDHEEQQAVCDLEFYKQLKALTLNKAECNSVVVAQAVDLYKTMLDLGQGASGAEMKKSYHLVDYEFHLDLCGWNDNPFQDGLQSLPAEIKQYVRLGGKLRLYEPTAGPGSKITKMDFLWKSTHDMSLLKWKICRSKEDEDPNSGYPHSASIGSMFGILKGTLYSDFAEIAKSHSLSESKCMTIIGSQTGSSKIVFMLEAKNQKERDTFLSALALWRDASAYGFH